MPLLNSVHSENLPRPAEQMIIIPTQSTDIKGYGSPISFYVLLLLMVLQSLYTIKGYAQSVDKLNLTNVVPPSPEVSALGKYLAFPMNYSSGVPVISIPLYTAKSGALSVPLSLSYNASGIRVEEVASWAGLGWSLSTGPSLYRVVHGQPDDFSTSDGYMYTTRKAKTISDYPNGSADKLSAYYDITDNRLDVEPDIYYFSAMGYSGKFYYDQQQQTFVQMPKSQVQISYQANGTGQITQWILTLPDGSKYFFGKTEDQTRSAYDVFNSSNTISFGPGGASLPSATAIGTPSHITNWQIMQIRHPEGSKIDYFYTLTTTVDFGRGGETTDYLGSSSCDYADNQIRYSSYANEASKSILQKISTANADIEFITATTLRQDVIGGSKALEKIHVKSKTGQLLRSFRLNTGYWTSAAETTPIPIPQIGLGDPYTVATKRLYLSSFDELDKNEANSKRHVFTYNETNLPSRLSAAQDYWGYFNGASNGFLLSPRVRAGAVNNGPSGYVPGADRRVDTVLAQARVLTSIVYPTGGRTSYVYESNRVSKENISSPHVNDFQFSALLGKNAILLKTPGNLQAGSMNIYTKTFVVGPNPTLVDIEYSGCNGNVSTLDCPLSTVIQGISNPSFSLALNQANLSYSLPEGTYKITTTINFSFENPDPDFSVVLSWEEEEPGQSNQLVVGALRIKKMLNEAVIGNQLTRVFQYNQFANATKSSGYILNLPAHLFGVHCGSGIPAPGATPVVVRRVSYSALPLNGGDGQMVRYTNITEYTDETKLQKTEYTYSHDPYDFINSATLAYPFPPVIYRDWRSGLLLGQRQYEHLEGGSYRLLTEKNISYAEYEPQASEVVGLKFGSTPNPGSFSIGNYDIHTDWYLKTAETDTAYTYNAANQVEKLVQRQTFAYNKNNGYLLTDSWSTGSTGKTLHHRFSYPKDYDNSTGFNTTALLNQNMVNLPIRKESHVNGMVNDGEIIKYNTAGLPIEIYAFEGNQIDTLTLNPLVAVPAHYKLRKKMIYHGAEKQNLVELATVDGLKETFLWSNNNEYPIAHVKNASFQEVSNLLTIATINSFGALDCPDKTTIANFVNPLNGGLPNAHMAMFAYNQAGNILSNVDARGMTTYYDYDDFNRLKSIRDHSGNVVKSFAYHYKEEQSNTISYTNAVQSQSFTRNNCNEGQVGGAVVYTVAAGSYSSTVSQAAADALALADIAANGQAHANVNGTCSTVVNCKRYRLTIPMSVSANLYLSYKECGSSSYVLKALDEMDVEMDENDNNVLYLCINGTMADFQFRYGATGNAQLIPSIMVEMIEDCQ
ncbi:DUF5977 domain-containing protein [Pedobacter sp. ASV28]|uniref:DUF5977 domain-containing protein n=1 Tax=Pedobacter sp. ASV28 TaxID=2795123 RepID=UPI0018EA84E6|nr:DUF5977 domain-containing protein [Pedobacter sp. ASV28]